MSRTLLANTLGPSKSHSTSDAKSDYPVLDRNTQYDQISGRLLPVQRLIYHLDRAHRSTNQSHFPTDAGGGYLVRDRNNQGDLVRRKQQMEQRSRYRQGLP